MTKDTSQRPRQYRLGELRTMYTEDIFSRANSLLETVPAVLVKSIESGLPREDMSLNIAIFLCELAKKQEKFDQGMEKARRLFFTPTTRRI